MSLMPRSYFSVRSSRKTHTQRPHAGSSARFAWDLLSTRYGPLTSMRLVEGWWMYQLTDMTVKDGVEACVVIEMLRKNGHPE